MRLDGKKVPESLKGYFLISESNMLDPNFQETVVLILEHNAEGAFGIVVNRRSRLTLGDILPEFAHERGFQTPVYVGGPVQQEYLFVVHSELPENEKSDTVSEVVKGVFFEPSFRYLQKYFEPQFWESVPADDRPKIHLFLGYSGWAPGQLEREMQSGSWVIHRASPRIVFHHNPEQGWRDALKDKGGIYKIFAESNQNPSLN